MKLFYFFTLALAKKKQSDTNSTIFNLDELTIQQKLDLFPDPQAKTPKTKQKGLASEEERSSLVIYDADYYGNFYS